MIFHVIDFSKAQNKHVLDFEFISDRFYQEYLHALMFQIKLHFYEEFSSLLKQDDVSGQPVLDPTQGKII